jgi:hypothetical protein
MRPTILATASLAAVVLCGCGDVPRGRIHGTVKFQGKPLSATTVIFLAKDNKTHLAKLKSDGTFDVSGVALGPIKVSLQQDLPAVASKSEYSNTPSSQAKGVSDEKAGKPPASEVKLKTDTGFHLPAQYADAEKSGLTFELTQVDQEWSVDLK